LFEEEDDILCLFADSGDGLSLCWWWSFKMGGNWGEIAAHFRGKVMELGSKDQQLKNVLLHAAQEKKGKKRKRRMLFSLGVKDGERFVWLL